MNKLWLFLILPLLLGATIHGTVYDLDLSVKKRSIVEIDTKPAQLMVAKDGDYSFTVPNGKYSITASFEDYTVKEEVEVIGEGEYILDLILGPETEQIPTEFPWWAVFSLTTLALCGFGAWTLKRMRRMPDDLKPVLEFIQKQEGRTTQAEIVHNFPVSEAKISLMLAELENLGKIKKIKKGRGNIVVLS